MENALITPNHKYGSPNAPIKLYTLDLEDIKQYSSVVIKNNTIIQMEAYGQDDQGLSGMDVQILSTAFLMAQCIKENRGGFDANTVFEIPMESFCKLWKISLDKNVRKAGNIYRELIHSVSRLNERNFSYPDINNSKMVESGYFSHIKYNATTIEFAFPIPIIDYIKKENDFTWYFLENILKLQDSAAVYKISQYAILLYEHLQRDKVKAKYISGHEHTLSIEFNKLKSLLGVEPGRWAVHHDFRRSLLNKVVLYIQQRIGMNIMIENIFNTNRSIWGYKFTTNLSKKDLDFKIAMLEAKKKSLMTDLQRSRFAGMLIAHTTFDSKYRLQNEANPEFYKRVEDALKKDIKLAEFEPYLRAIGYKAKKFDQYLAGLDEETKKKLKVIQTEAIVMQGDLSLDMELPF